MPSTNGVYTGEALRAVAMPLGGLGTGTIALAGDGSLRQWQIHNQVNHTACVPHSFFAVWARTHRPPTGAVAKVLQSAALYGHDGVPAPPTSNDHVVPIPHRRLLSKIPGVQAVRYSGRYPIAELSYLDDQLPVDVRLEAFNPFIPLNEVDSGIPAILFNFTITNPTDRIILVSVAASLQNALGWDGVAPIFDTRCMLYGGNSNELIRGSGQTTIAMSNGWLPSDHERAGTMALSVDSGQASWLTQWDDLRAFWDDFASDGRLACTSNNAASVAGRSWNGALAESMTLEPGETRAVRFTLAWHFPNRQVNYSQAHYFQFHDDRSRFYLGNRYNRWFGSAMDVVAHVDRECNRLTTTTRLARNTFYDTTLPFALIDAVTAQMSIARTPSCFWVEDGSFYGFEGCNGVSTPHNEPVGGCCPLNCTHVWNYEMALARLFPALERSMRDTEWDIQQHPSGYLPHRVLLPVYLPRVWDRTIGGPANPALDGLLGAILKTYREFLSLGDDQWMTHVWPRIKLALDYVWTAHDPDRTGIIEGEQPNTYDISIYGANTFIGTLYLAALRVVEELANRFGEQQLASECRSVFERGRRGIEARLWNGEYYIQQVDFDRFPVQNWGTGCHTDQLLGQWWANLLGLGHLLDPEHIHTATTSIVKHNFRDTFAGYEPPVQIRQLTRHFVIGEDQGLLLCTWPNGGRPNVPTQYSDEVWTGMEYEVAALLLQQGEPELATKVISAVRNRYDGTKQNPWNDIECGDHYVRAMASWSLLEAASGFFYDASRSAIGFDPVMDTHRYRAPFIGRDGWGTFEQSVIDSRQTVRIAMRHGELAMTELRLGNQTAKALARLTLGGGPPVGSTSQQRGATLFISLETPLVVGAGQELRVTIG